MRKTIPPEVEKLARAIDLIAREGWRGLPALTGAEPLQRDKIAALFEARGVDELTAGNVFESWPHILEAVRTARADHANEWNIYAAFIFRKAIYIPHWGGRSVAAVIAEKFNSTEWTVRRTVRKMPVMIAQYAGRLSTDAPA